MNREDIIRMAREAGMEQDGDNFFSPSHEEIDVHITDLERFAALVAAAEREKEKERQRYDIHSCGPDCDRYICVAVRNEREACAKVCEVHGSMARHSVWMAEECAALIRARSNT